MNPISPSGPVGGAQPQAKVNWKGIASVEQAVAQPLSLVKAVSARASERTAFEHKCTVGGKPLPGMQSVLPGAANAHLAQSQATFSAAPAA